MSKPSDPPCPATSSPGVSPLRMDPAAGAESRVDPAAEQSHWRERFEREPYHKPGRNYKDYHPAYELGWSRRAQSDAHFDSHEDDLAREWAARHHASPLDWPEARAASRAAWQRADAIYYEQARNIGMAESFAFIQPQGDAAGAPSAASAAMTNDEVVDVLNHLLENARDGEHGFHVCTEEVKGNDDLKLAFNERADQYRDAGEELLPLIANYGGTPADGGTVRGALHRGWVHVKGAVGADDAESMAAEAERAEDASVDRYRSALQHKLPADVRAVVERQSAVTRESHDIFRELRDGLGEEG